jgi:branched-chain amino acid transport system ATP-binding protein
MALLEVNSLTAFYGDFQALYGVSLSVDEGQAVAVIGANGAGKSTLLKSVVGMIRAAPGMIRFNGEPIGGIRSPKIVARGVTMVPEGRRLFSSLTVEENLRIGGQLAVRVHGRCSVCSSFFRCWRSGAARRVPRCPADSSKWSRSAAR